MYLVLAGFWIITLGYFAFAAFIFYYVIRFQNNLYRRFPTEAISILGHDKAFGLVNKKLGFSLLRNSEVKELTKHNNHLEKQRKTAILLSIIFTIVSFLFPILMFPIYYLGRLISR